MPTYQQKVHVERHMNGHWDRLAAQKAVVDSHWKPGESPNCMPRQEHHVLRSRRLQRENMKLYNKLYGISTTNAVSATAQHIANHTRDPDEAELLNQQREWQRKHDRQQKQANVDRENLKIFHTITNAKSLVQSADSMAREYRERQLLLVHENDVKDTDLHLHIRRHHPNHHTLLASPVSSREKHSLSPCISPIKLPSSGRSRSRGGSSSSSRRRRPEVDLSSPVLEGRMPGKMRGLMRSNSAHNTRKGRSSKGHGSRRSASNSSWKKSSRVKNEEHDDWEDDVERVYKILAERAALRVTPEDMDTYTSEENWEDGFEDHVSREESEEDDDDDVAPLQRVLFSDTATDTLLSSPCEIPQNSNTKEADEPSTPPWRVASEQYDTPHLPGLCRRNLFYHTSLQAHVHMIVSSHDHSDDHSNDDSAPQPDAVFAVKMYDVGESCDARLFKGKAAGDTRSERGGRAWANESCDGDCKVEDLKSSSANLVPTTSGILLACQLQPETEKTQVHHLFISLADVKGLISRCHAKSSTLWTRLRAIPCIDSGRALYNCLTDRLSGDLQNQLGGLLAKQIELTVNIDPRVSAEQELAERISVDFKFQL